MQSPGGLGVVKIQLENRMTATDCRRMGPNPKAYRAHRSLLVAYVAFQVLYPTLPAHAQSALGVNQAPAPLTVSYTSRIWTVCSTRVPYAGPRFLVFGDGTSKAVSPQSRATASTFTYYVSNTLSLGEGYVVQTSASSPPDVLRVLQDGTLMLGMRLSEYHIRFLGPHSKAVDVLAKADGISYEPVFADEDLLLMRPRGEEGAKQIVLVPLSGSKLEFTRRLVLTDESGRPAALSAPVRFERKGTFVKWRDAEGDHAFRIPASLLERPR